MTIKDERYSVDSPVDALTRLFYILGSPIAHVRAPIVWSALFKRYGVNALMLPADVTLSNFNTAMKGLKATENVDGAIFTMPHKLAAVDHADALTQRARRIGSINLLRRLTDGTWEGDNVDGADEERARELARSIATVSSARLATGIPSMENIDIAINASPVGLNASDALPFPVDALPSHALVADVIMEPHTTALLGAAQARGLKVHHGKNMMNYAMPIAASFFGFPPSFDWNGNVL
ncbi:shikimate 5-dehydrogenase [Burkholderia sp. Ch1-1]|nr:shikimate 5-dehydrogenase [Burkholderia sp. Ch1-1]